MSYRTIFAAVLAFAIAAPIVRAQQQGGSNSGTDRSTNSGDNNSRSNRGNRGSRGGFDPSRITDMIKERLAPTDDEWKVIQPKLEKVTEARRDSMSSMYSMFRRRSSDSNSNSSSSSDASRSPMQQASQDLRDVLDKKDATADEINGKLTAYREARDKSRQALTAAQKDLKDVLTQRQEAVLVSMGILD